MINKKSQGISINAIIMAAIALIVLVVLVAIFTGRLGTWGKGIEQFNPDKDFLLGVECKPICKRGICPEEKPNYCLDIPFYEGVCTIGYCDVAKDWRPKTFCERCVDKKYLEYVNEPNVVRNKEMIDCEYLCTCEEYEQYSKLNCNFDYESCGAWITWKEWEEMNLVEKTRASIPLIGTATIKNAYKICKTNPILRLDENGDIIMDDIFIENFCDTDNYSICIKAREKPKPIEINLEEEKCVELTNESVHPKGTTFDCSQIYEQISIWEKRDYTHIMEGWQDKYNEFCCIKKEKLNECEKGNGDYIEDCNFYRLFAKDNCSWGEQKSYLYTKEAFEMQDNWREFATHYTCEEKTCRKKQLEDYSCKELNEAFHKDWSYCRSTNKLTDKRNNWCGRLDSEKELFKDSIYDIAIEKGCDT